MATLISAATGNWTAAATWKVCNATAELDSEAGQIATGTSYAFSSSFTPGAIEVDGIAVRLSLRGGSSGTFTVCIGQGGSPVTGTEVTIDVVDINNTSNLPSAAEASKSMGWYFFKFASPVTLAGATAYTIGFKSSVSSAVTLYRDATANNVCRQLRTTTTQAPAAGDKLFVIGEHTGQGTGNDFTVTMNNTDNTDYGTGSTTLASLGVGKRGTLTFGSAASTSYNLRLSGLLWIYSSGTLNIGTVATPIPSTSSAKLEFDCAANNDFSLTKGVGGKLVIQGNALTYDRAKLAADASAGASTITTDVSTGWKNGDTIVIAGTNRGSVQAELKTLNGDASGTTVTITGTLSYDHGGTGLYIAEVIHLTRNVKIASVNASYHAYMNMYCNTDSNGSVDIDWAEFYDLGTSTTYYTMYIYPGVANHNIQRCSFRRCYGVNYGQYGNFTFSNNVMTQDGDSMNLGWLYQNAASSAAAYIENNWFIGATQSNGHAIVLYGGELTCSNNIVANFTGYNYQLLNSSYYLGTFSDNSFHSHAGSFCLVVGGCSGGVVNNLTGWGAGSVGIYIWSSSGGSLTFNNMVLYGVNEPISMASVNALNVRFIGGSIHGTSTMSSLQALMLNAQNAILHFSGMNIGGTATGKTDFTQQAIEIVSGHWTDITFHNCTWGAITRLTNTIPYDSRNVLKIAFSKDNGVEGSDYVYVNNGRLDHDASNGIGGSDCLKITPTGNANFLDISPMLDIMPVFQCPAQDGVQRTVYIQAKDDISFDGTNVDISLWMNGTKVVDWTAIEGTLTTTYNEYSLQYTPTEDGILELAIRTDGDAGSIYLDGFRWA